MKRSYIWFRGLLVCALLLILLPGSSSASAVPISYDEQTGRVLVQDVPAGRKVFVSGYSNGRLCCCDTGTGDETGQLTLTLPPFSAIDCIKVFQMGDDFTPQSEALELPVAFPDRDTPVTGQCGEAALWSLDKETGLLTISGTGPMADYASGQTPWYSDRALIKSIRVEEGITRVGDHAFSYGVNVTAVALADTVTSIGSYAFSANYVLDSLFMPGVTMIEDHAFANCNALGQFQWPAELSQIGDYAFYGCGKLANPLFSNTLTGMGMYAFAYCDSITQITLPASLARIGDYTFDSCKGLTSISLPDSMTTLSAYMFRGCSALEQVVLPKDLTAISPYAFADCLNLVWVWIPDGVTTIGPSAFECCARIERILIPQSVTSIGAGAFYHCLNLSSACYFGTQSQWAQVSVAKYNEPLLNALVEFDPHVYTAFTVTKPVTCTTGGTLQYTAADGSVRSERLQALGHRYEMGPDETSWTCQVCGDTVATSAGTLGYGSCGPNLTWLLSADGTLTVSGEGPMVNVGVRTSAPWYDVRESVLRAVVEPGVTYLGQEAFSYCIHMTSAVLPDTMTAVGEDAFNACYVLTDVTLPAKLVELGNGAFFGCYSLPAITLPDTLATIGEYAFYNCEALTAIQFPQALTSMGQYAFAYCDALTELTLPASLTNIGPYTFDSCKGLKSVSLPDSMETMSPYMFRGCSAIETMVLPAALSEISPYCFADCTALRWIWIPNGVTAVGPSAFEACSGLPRILLPGTVTSIGSGAFYHCINLSSACYFGSEEDWAQVFIAGNNAPLTALDLEFDDHPYNSFSLVTAGTCTQDTILRYQAGDGATRTESIHALGHQYEGLVCTVCQAQFSTTQPLLGSGSCSADIIWYLTEDGTLTILGTGAMPNYGVLSRAPWYDLRTSILRAVVEPGITYVGGEAFSYCVNLEQATLADSVTTIGSSAFHACYKLASVRLPAQLERLDDHAFFGCHSLTSIALPNTLTSIGEYAFYNCEALAAPIFPASLTTIEQWAFAYCDAFSSITLSEGLITLGDYAFDSCKGLKAVSLPDSLTTLGIYAFRGCSLLDTINIPPKITAIGQNTFDACSSLTHIILPESVTQVGMSAFYNCTALTDVVIPAQACSFSSAAFGRCSDQLTIWGVPGSAVETYATSNGIQFADLAGYQPPEEPDPAPSEPETPDPDPSDPDTPEPDTPEPDTPEPEIPALEITEQPSSISVSHKATATFQVSASGDGLTYQWQFSTDGGSNWKAISGAVSNAYSVECTKKMNGYLYRCVVGDAYGASVTSDAATLTVS